jgi:hypothetical protein
MLVQLKPFGIEVVVIEPRRDAYRMDGIGKDGLIERSGATPIRPMHDAMKDCLPKQTRRRWLRRLK